MTETVNHALPDGMPLSLQFDAIIAPVSYFSLEHILAFNEQQGLGVRHNATTTAYLQLLHGQRVSNEWGWGGASRARLSSGTNLVGLVIAPRSEVGLQQMSVAAGQTDCRYLKDWAYRRGPEAALAIQAGSFVDFWNRYQAREESVRVHRLYFGKATDLMAAMQSALVQRFESRGSLATLLTDK